MFRNRHGQSLVEVIVAIGILSVGGSAVIIMILGSLRGADLGGQQTIASAYARQGLEAVKSVGKSGYNRLAAGTYSLTETGNVWGLTPGSDTNGIYTRTVAVADVNRDGSGDIVTIGGTKDIGTRKVTTTVSWPHAAGVRTYETVDYFTYWDSSRFFEDVVADFSDGTFSNTETSTVADPDGSVRLAALPPSLWACFEADGVLDNAGTGDGRDVFVVGTTAYVATLTNAGPEFLVIDVTNPNAPTLTGSLEIGANVNGLYVSGTNAFLATSDNTSELRVVSVATPSAPTSIGTLNLTGTVDALDILVTGSRAYLTRANDAGGSEFFTINVTTPSAPALLGSVDLGANANGIVLSGTNAFVVTDGDAAEFRVVSVAVDAAPSVSATIDLPSAANGTDIDLFGTKAYVVTAVNGTGSEFYVINVATPASPVTQGSVDLGNGANAVVMDGTSAMIASAGVAGQSIQYVDAAVPTAPILSVSQRVIGSDFLGLFWTGSALFGASGADTSEFVAVNRQTTTDWGCAIRKGTFNMGSSANAVYVVGTTAYVVGVSVAGPEFYILNVSNPATPTLIGSLDIGANGNDVVVSGTKAYVASSDNAAELKVIDITTPATPSIVGSLNLAGTTDGQAVNITGTKVVLTQGSTFYNVNVAVPAAPATLGSVAIAGTGFRIEVLSSSIAYVATAGDAAEVQVMNITANAPSVSASFNAAGTADGRGLWIKGASTLYLTTDVNASGGEFYVLDITTPASPTQTGVLELGVIGRAAAADDNETYAFAGTTTASKALVAIRTTTPASPSVDSYLAGTAVVDAYFLNDTLYLATTDASNEFMTYQKPTQGGGGGGFQTNGTYVSSIMDAGQTANWNTVTWTPDVACVGSSLQLQVKTATTSGGLAGEMWQGPDGEDADETDFFTDATGHLIHTDHNGDRFMQYRATFAGPGTCASEMYDIEITGTVF